ncbi:ABC transporter permease [Ahrensia sp. R2A130]|uniref:ABC transporter permease n=1 Tax=Ahrensia sp. R2A130 TaxID=744979 RepID=UPI0001E09C3B|nr:ABC transporter permease [Ahrensia sp. R2A130]EFL89613.1 ABC transporter, permease protein [Ahrensia sp. R2A130]
MTIGESVADVTSSTATSVRPESAQNAASLPLALRFALRELRGGLTGFYVFLACIALGVAAISGVNAVALSITQGIAQEGRTLLGGDLSFKTQQRELTQAERAWVTAQGETSTAATMRAMARKPDGSDQSLVELKAVNNTWPLTGSFVAEPADALARGAVVDPVLLSRLQIEVGDSISIGAETVEITGTIVTEPDRVSDNFLLGPRVIISREVLDRTELVQPGSLVSWTTRLALADATQENVAATSEAAKAEFPEAGWRVRGRDNAAPALTRNVTRFSQFLTLVGLTALIVGGVGVANAVRAYLDTKGGVIATFKSLGAPAWFVFAVYLMQILALALLGIAIGLLLGALAPPVAKWALADVLPVASAQVFYPGALLSAIAYGLLTALAFALWPLGQARDIPAIALFRNAARDNAPWPRSVYVVATAIVVAALVGLAVWQAGDRRIAWTFIGGIAVSFVLLRVVAMGIQWIAKRMPQVRSTPLRLAIGNIHRPGALTPSVVMSLGLGLALLVALALIDGNLRNQISANIPKQAPDFFFVDVQSNEVEPFVAKLEEVAPNGVVQQTPMLRGRIVSINDVPAAEIQVKEGGEWVLRGDRGVTYSPVKPENASVSEGEWWAADHSGENLVSFAAEEADEVGVSVGDKLTINVLGRDITATVANLRNVEWRSFSMNFVMVFSPNTFAGAPHAYLATLQVDPSETLEGEATAVQTARDGDILREVTTAFPTVTTVRVRDALSTVNGLIEQLATAIRAAALLALAASILVLAGALAAGNRARTHDAVVLKTLGATRKVLISAFVTEYSLLGLATAIFALLAGGLASWFVIDGIMGFTFTLLPSVAIGTVVAALVFTVGFGLVGTWRVLGQKAAPVLREL